MPPQNPDEDFRYNKAFCECGRWKGHKGLCMDQATDEELAAMAGRYNPDEPPGREP